MCLGGLRTKMALFPNIPIGISNSVTIPYFSVFSVHFWNFQTNVELSFNFHHRYAGAGWGVLEMSEESYGVPLGVSGGEGKAFVR